MAVDEVVIRAVLRDELSRGLHGIREEVQRLDKQMVAAQRASTGLSSSVTGLNRNIIGSTTGINRMTSSLASLAGRGIQTASYGLAGLSVAAVGFGLKAAASFQSSEIAFGTLLGSVEKGHALFGELQKFNLQTPFGLQDISSATQTLLQFGFTADNVMQTLKGISDVAALTDDPGSNLSRIAVALGQINGAGVLRAQDLNQLVQSGFPAYKLLQNITGQTAQEIRKQMESGLTIPADKFIEAVQKQTGVLATYAGGAAAQAKTLRGIWSNFVDMLRIRLSSAMQPLADTLQTMLPQFSDSLGAFIDKAAPALSRIAINLLDMLTRALPAAEPLITGLFNAISQLLTSPVMGQLGTSLADLITQFVPQIPDLITAFIGLAMVLPPLVDVLSKLVPVVTPATKLVPDVGATLPDPQSHHGVGYYGSLLTAPIRAAFNVGSSISTRIRGGTSKPTSSPYTGGAKPATAVTGGGSVVNVQPGAVVVNNPAAHIDVARAVQQGIEAAEAQKKRRG